MSRKNKIMAAIAAGALVLLVGSGVARCSLASADGTAPEEIGSASCRERV